MIASSYLFLIESGKILLSRRYHTGYEDGKYSVPAGHVEDNETLTDCLIREVREEIGITILPEDARLVHVMHRKESDIRVDFFFTVSSWDGTIQNKEPNKCDDLQWFSVRRLPNTTIPYIREAIVHVLKKEFYSERGWSY